MPTPASGACAADQQSLHLLQLMQRCGFPRLMERLGFAFGGVSGQYGLGNRQRIDFVHVRADDVEQISLALADADVLLVHTPAVRLAAPLEAARWRLQRIAFGNIIRRLRADGIALARDEVVARLHCAWLTPAAAARRDNGEADSDDDSPDGSAD